MYYNKANTSTIYPTVFILLHHSLYARGPNKVISRKSYLVALNDVYHSYLHCLHIQSLLTPPWSTLNLRQAFCFEKPHPPSSAVSISSGIHSFMKYVYLLPFIYFFQSKRYFYTRYCAGIRHIITGKETKLDFLLTDLPFH